MEDTDALLSWEAEPPEKRRRVIRRRSTEEQDLSTTVGEAEWFHAQDHSAAIAAAVEAADGQERDLHMLDMFSASEKGKEMASLVGIQRLAWVGVVLWDNVL